MHAFALLYEDDHMLAVDKPAGLVVHPTYKNPAGTLLDAIRARGVPRPSVVGRLDKLTSGIVIVAKSAEAHARLQQALAAPDAEKIYLAIVHGCVDVPSGRIDLKIRVDERDRRHVVVSRDVGAPSVTLFERLRVTGAGLSLLECRPLTGRRHQIRAHLAAAGWPIVGDVTYGGEPGQPRHALHCWRVAFQNPLQNASESVDKQSRVLLEAPIPDHFASLLTLLS